MTHILDLLAYQFMVNAFMAGTIASVLAAVVGWYVVLRREAFAAHTLAIVGFPGASAAALIGWPIAVGYFVFTGLGALAMMSAAGRAGGRQANETATVGTIQAFALGLGYLFGTLSHSNASAAQALLFGSFLGITTAQVAALAVIAALVLGTMARIARPLFLTSIDEDVALARGVPARGLTRIFVVVVAVTVATVSLITGALLVFALLVMPAATAQRLTARPGLGITYAVLIAVAVMWAGLATSYVGNVPIGFTVTSYVFAAYVVVRVASSWASSGTSRAPSRSVA